MKTLIPLIDYVLWIRGMTTKEFCEAFPNDTVLPTWKGNVDKASREFIVLDAIKWRLIGDMAKFLKQKPELWMFVPCDKDGNVIEEPTENEKNEFGGALSTIEEQAELYSAIKEYQKAKERVLFKGITFINTLNDGGTKIFLYYGEKKLPSYSIINKFGKMTLEDLTHLGLELTDKAF